MTFWRVWEHGHVDEDFPPVDAESIDEARDEIARTYGFANHAEWLADGRPEIEMHMVIDEDAPLPCPNCRGMGVLAVGAFGEEPECSTCGGSGEWWPQLEHDEPRWLDDDGGAA